MYGVNAAVTLKAEIIDGEFHQEEHCHIVGYQDRTQTVVVRVVDPGQGDDGLREVTEGQLLPGHVFYPCDYASPCGPTCGICGRPEYLSKA